MVYVHVWNIAAAHNVAKYFVVFLNPYSEARAVAKNITFSYRLEKRTARSSTQWHCFSIVPPASIIS